MPLLPLAALSSECAPTTIIQILLTAPDGATLTDSTVRLRGLAGVESVSLGNVAIGGTSSLSVSYRGDVAALRAALAGLGWSVDEAGGALRGSRGAVPAPPAPAPTPTP